MVSTKPSYIDGQSAFLTSAIYHVIHTGLQFIYLPTFTLGLESTTQWTKPALNDVRFTSSLLISRETILSIISFFLHCPSKCQNGCSKGIFLHPGPRKSLAWACILEFLTKDDQIDPFLSLAVILWEKEKLCVVNTEQFKRTFFLVFNFAYSDKDGGCCQQGKTGKKQS